MKSVMKKYCTFSCLVLFEMDVCPFSANSIVLLLSWYLVVVVTCTTCAAKKYLFLGSFFSYGHEYSGVPFHVHVHHIWTVYPFRFLSSSIVSVNLVVLHHDDWFLWSSVSALITLVHRNTRAVCMFCHLNLLR